MDNLKKLQDLLGPTCKENFPLGPMTTLKVGGPADLFLEAKTRDILIHALQEAIRLHVPYFVLGGGSNILIGDRGIRRLVVKNMTKDIVVRGVLGKVEQGKQAGTVFVEADSGVIFNSLVRFTVEEGYEGIEMHLGLPGTVGGALYMNSKWTHPEGYVGDVLYQATILDQKGNLTTVPHSYFQFAYDSSVLQKSHDTVISAMFGLKRSTREILWARANESIAYRRSTQPQGVLTPGCTFRNIPFAHAMRFGTPDHTTSAGYLIDAAGLKGYRVGNAEVSSVHANFIVNLGGATASDVVKLIEYVRGIVFKKTGIQLEEEIVRVGEF